MSSTIRRIRFLESPYADQLFDAHVDDIAVQSGARGQDIVLSLQLLRSLAVPELRVVDGLPCEVIRGERIAAKLRFENAAFHLRNGVFERFAELPPVSGARRLFGASRWRDSREGEFYWIVTGSDEAGDLGICAKRCVLELLEVPPDPAVMVRRWANTPPPRPHLSPHRPVQHRRYGGDPITIHLGNRALHSRFFIGGLHHQHNTRPNVDAVLNLCGLDNPWCERYGQHPCDRVSARGEGAHGMTVDDLLEEASWVAGQLRDGKSVLVHCYAGMNRSATVCCAALMLLEGIGAEEALARVRQRHPIAWPDPYHWFTLHWLARKLDGEREPAAATNTERAPLLREVSAVG